MDRLPLLYDEDCGVCRVLMALALRWDRDRRLRPVALGSREAGELLEGMSPVRRAGSWHLATPVGVRSAGAAFPALLEVLPAGHGLAGLSRRAPGLSERGYRLVADNRSRLSALVPASARRRADAVIAERT